MTEVVKTSRNDGGIWIISMEDYDGRNTFTPALVAGLFEAIKRIGSDSEARAIVLHGFDTIFLAGGTMEELIGIAERKQRFDEAGFYRLLLDCPVPVISAMQGHALGGGLVFGLYAEIVVMASESLYSANFMKYGFTPGMGATMILPEKLGIALGEEMLLTARSYHGGVLEARGVPFPVVPRAKVISTALGLAQDLADKPPQALRLLKKHMNRDRVSRLQNVVDLEIAMHDITFAASEVPSRIRDRWGNK
ncbi:ptzG [Candidatus Endolissoclinum faulkneri L5]|uniref:PtzG n=2 Tax=Candidatus Endolissoclinum faulkneri TaxID=1263979 RepID=V9TSU5_9PROT|nr:polyketide synthase [Candidatus Endolissoclinum faulkneri]AHC73994.1 ptzG [Candidatus Endolissoclinum faulkneri L5]